MIPLNQPNYNPNSTVLKFGNFYFGFILCFNVCLFFEIFLLDVLVLFYLFIYIFFFFFFNNIESNYPLILK
jgi:hypothetical protein